MGAGLREPSRCWHEPDTKALGCMGMCWAFPVWPRLVLEPRTELG